MKFFIAVVVLMHLVSAINGSGVSLFNVAPWASPSILQSHSQPIYDVPISQSSSYSTSVVQHAPTVVRRLSIVPEAPIVHEPVLYHAPIVQEVPIVQEPLLYHAPISQSSSYSTSVVQSVPIVHEAPIVHYAPAQTYRTVESVRLVKPVHVEGQYVAANPGAIHTAPLSGHSQSVSALNLGTASTNW